MVLPSDGDENRMADGSAEPAWERGLSIREMAAKYGISLRTLRFYEQRGLLSPKRYNFGRVYNPGDEAKVQLVLTGRRLGFTLLEIKRITESETRAPRDAAITLASLLNASEIERRLRALEERRRRLDTAIAELRQKIGCD